MLETFVVDQLFLYIIIYNYSIITLYRYSFHFYLKQQKQQLCNTPTHSQEYENKLKKCMKTDSNSDSKVVLEGWLD